MGRTHDLIKRDLILKAAFHEFDKNGYAKASVSKIAKRAKVSKPTVYSHFADKHALYQSVVEDATSEINQVFIELFNSLAESRQTGLEPVLKLMSSNDRKTSRVKRLQKMMTREGASHPEVARIFYERIDYQLIGYLAGLIQSKTGVSKKEGLARATTIVGSFVYLMLVEEVLEVGDLLRSSRSEILRVLSAVFSSSDTLVGAS